MQHFLYLILTYPCFIARRLGYASGLSIVHIRSVAEFAGNTRQGAFTPQNDFAGKCYAGNFFSLLAVGKRQMLRIAATFWRGVWVWINYQGYFISKGYVGEHTEINYILCADFLLSKHTFQSSPHLFIMAVVVCSVHQSCYLPLFTSRWRESSLEMPVKCLLITDITMYVLKIYWWWREDIPPFQLYSYVQAGGRELQWSICHILRMGGCPYPQGVSTLTIPI